MALLVLKRYRTTVELQTDLDELPTGRRIFLTPSSADRTLLSEMWRRNHDSTPCTLLWNDLYRLIAETAEAPWRAQIDPPDHWLILRAVLKDLNHDEELPPAALCRGFLDVLGDQIRELLAEEIPPAALPRTGPMERLLARSYEAYTRRLASLNLLDSASLTSEARKLVERFGPKAWPACTELVLVGFYSLTHSQLGLVRALRAAGVSLRCHMPDDGMRQGYDLVCQLAGEKNFSPSEPLVIRRIAAGDSRGELETVARTLALWEAGHDELSIGHPWPGWEAIGLWMPGTRELEAHEVLRRYDLPFRVGRSPSAAESPLWLLAEAIWNAASEGWDATTADLLALPAMGQNKLASDRALHGLKEWRVALGPQASRPLDDGAAFASALMDGGTPLEVLSALRRLGRARLTAFRGVVSDDPALDDDLAGWNGALEELDRKILSIEETCRDLGEAGQERLSGGEAWDYLRAWAHGTAARPRPSLGDALELWSGSTPVLLSRPYWFMTDASGAAWPGGLSEAPLLDDRTRSKLHQADASLDATHLPLLFEKRRQREMAFRRLAASGTALTVISWPRQDSRCRPLEATSLLRAAIDDGWFADSATPLCRDLDDLLPKVGARLAPVEVRAPSPASPWPTKRDRPGHFEPPEELKLSMSHIDDFVTCPYRFYVQHVLRLSPPRPVRAFDHQRAGTATHALWELVWKAKATSAKESLLTLSRQERDRVFGRHYPELLSAPELARHKARLWTRIDGCATFQETLEDRLAPRRQAVETEVNLPPIHLGSATLVGRADRLDRLDDGRFILWDYKAGASTAYGSSLQLAFYALALTGDEKFESVAGWGFLGLADGAMKGRWNADWKARFDPKGRSSLEKTIELAQETQARLDECIRSGLWQPAWDNRNVCARCEFSGFCRRGELHRTDDEGGDDQ